MRLPDEPASAVLQFRRFRLHLYGATAASHEQLQQLIEPAKDLSAAVRLLADHYVDAGFPASRLHYMLVDDDLYLVAMRGKIVGVDAPEPLRPYFEPLIGHEPLRTADLEPPRLLAALHADRTARSYAAELQPADTSGSVLQLREVNGDADRSRVDIGIGNSGNRFTGRHLMDVLADYSLDTGDRFSLGWQTALRGLNDSQRSGRFDDFLAGWSRVHPVGIFSLRAQLTSYTFDVSGPVLDTTGADARIVEVEAGWQYPLAAGMHHRIIASSQLDYTHKRAELDDGTRLQNEEYPSIQVGIEGSWMLPLPEPRQLTMTAGLDLRQGLGGDSDPQRVDEKYLLGTPRLTAAMVLDDRWEVLLHGELQITRDTLPEQSQWVLGGVDYLEAWLPGVAIGDSGSLARLQVSFLEGGSLFDVELIPAVFVEYGHARYERPLQDVRPAGTVEISDVGAVIEMQHARGVRARVSAAYGIADNGLADEVLQRNEANFYFSVTATF